MEDKKYPALEPEFFKAFCRRFTDVILRDESGTWICPPLSVMYRTIEDFFIDIPLQKDLLGNQYNDIIFIRVDLKQKEFVDRKEFESIAVEAIFSKIHYKKLSVLELVNYVNNTLGKKLILFVDGIDKMIRNNYWEIIDELAYIAQINLKTHVFVISETDITHSQFFTHYSKRSLLCQNIQIIPRFDPSQAIPFMKYLSHEWHVVLTPDQEKWITDNCGGHLFFIVEVFRQVAKNPHISYEDLNKIDTFLLKAKAIFSNFLEDEQKVLISVANRYPIPLTIDHSKNFLLKLGWIRQEKDIYTITVPLVKQYILGLTSVQQSSFSHLFVLLTKLERTVFENLVSNENKITKREDIGQYIWGDQHIEKYSDWAIDQLMHKLREKIRKANLPYEIVTKKGEGFIFKVKN